MLKRVFEAVPPGEIEGLIHAAPTGILARRVWYFYEILTGRDLNVDDAPAATAIDLLDPKAYFTGKLRLSKRHRVRDNLLGTGRFCPVIRRTGALTELLALDVSARARETVGRTSAHLVARAASFMLLADSRDLCPGTGVKANSRNCGTMKSPRSKALSTRRSTADTKAKLSCYV